MGYEIDFLPVGEESQSGDAIALRFGDLSGSRTDQFVAVVDGGFESTGEAVVQHVRKYYGTEWVNLVVSTHPDADHTGGLEVVLKELSPECLWMHRPWEHTDDIARMFRAGRVTDRSVRESLRRALDNARSLQSVAESLGIPIEEPFTGARKDFGGGGLLVVGPSEEYYESLLPDFRGTPEPKVAGVGLLRRAVEAAAEFVSKIPESLGLETLDDAGETSAENNSSSILLIQSDGHSLLLTADAGIPALTEVADILEPAELDLEKLKFIQVPHHGSKRNVGPTILNRLVGGKLKKDEHRKTAYVSAAKKGAPKHPAKKVTNAFRRRGAPVYATQGRSIVFRHDFPHRDGWSPVEPLELFTEVEE